MSRIKVWTSDGEWSKSVKGCDKIHLMKEAIACECSIAKDECKGKKELCFDLCRNATVINKKDGTKTTKTIHRSKLQIDNEAINVAELMDEEWKIEYYKLDLKNASFFKMRLSTLREMAEEEETMSAVYNRLIDLAKVPEEVTENYCLLFMFANE
ncbi:MAG: hypothetical protein J5741_04780 [Bacteroidales bacterium]|nr:hypothetical protein [Bacteroidales bacterium]